MASRVTKERKTEEESSRGRSWEAKPILGSEFTQDPPFHDVYVGILKHKQDISTAIQNISSILPGFNHLKRCSGLKLLLVPLNSPIHAVDLGKSSSQNDNLTEEEVKTLLKIKGFDLALLEDGLEIQSVPSLAPKTKSQASKASKIWPLNFHPDPSIERIMDGSIFNETQWNSIGEYMRLTIEVAKLEAVGTEQCNGSAMIVDPEDGRILSIAASRMNQHPMWHASMLAIDLIATLQGGGAWSLNHLTEDSSKDSQKQEFKSFQDRMKFIKRKYDEQAPMCYPKSLVSKIKDRLPRGKNLESDNRKKNNIKTKTSDVEMKNGPYLCTGYWIFLLREPCPLCAMGLLHSRASKIFYGTANECVGILGTKAILHTVPGLNHRYIVWSGILGQECHEALKEIQLRNTV